MDVAEGFRRIGAWEDRLAAPDFTLGAWEDGTTGDDGVIQMPWFAYSDEGRRLIRDLAAVIEVFDWMSWARTPRGQELVGRPEAIASATAAELRRVITAIVRGDRFTEGNVAGAFERGFLGAIARRAGELAGEGVPAERDPTEGRSRSRPAPRGSR
jgi:hypothetical protein